MLREVWMNIGITKVNMHKGITVKALLFRSAIEIFMDKKMTKKHSFRLQKLKRPLVVRNVDRTGNSEGNITHCKTLAKTT